MIGGNSMSLRGVEEIKEMALATYNNEEFNLEKTKQEVALKVKDSKEIQALIQQIDLNDANTIVKFGSSTAEEVSKLSDKILKSIETTKVEDSGKLLMQLNKIMDKFDIKDFEDNKSGFLGKLFNRAKNSVDALFNKYNTMGDEVEKVNIMLKEYEAEIIDANRDLEDMFVNNMHYYEELEKYIVAGRLAIEELSKEIIPEMEAQVEKSGDKIALMTVNNLKQMLEMMEQRVYDLELAQNVALQSLPSIRSIQKGNHDLVRKINSAFIVTLPIFKQCLAQSIILKRQSIQAEATKALDEKTKELLIRNAENTALQTKMTAQLASGSFVDVETLEKTWETIVRGIEETKEIQEEANQRRIEGRKKLLELKEDFSKRAGR